MSSKMNDLRTPLKRARGLGSAKDGTSHFFWQRVTAIATGLSGLWVIGMLLTMQTADYVMVHGMVADPINATVIIVFLLSMFWHARMGLQVIIEDYIHTPLTALMAHFVTIFMCALAAVASVLAVLRIVLGS